MSRPLRPPVARHYDVRVDGHLDEHWSAWFGARAMTPQDDGTTSLRAVVADQAELHGLLTKVRDLGLTLVSVTPVEADGPASADREPSRAHREHRQNPDSVGRG